jgi:hypothetical protein
VSVAATTGIWVAVAYLAPPTDRATLVSFYRLVRPAGPGWREVRKEAGVGPSPDSLPHAFAGFVLGCAFIYAGLFGAGSVIYGHTAHALVWLAVFIASGAGLFKLVPRLWVAEP